MGGIIYITGENAQIIDSTMKQAHAKYGGAIYVNGANTVINGSSVSMVSVDYNGGAVYIAGYNAIIENSSFDKSNATGRVVSGKHTDGNGGAIYVEGDSASIIDSKFNITIAVHGSGGAIYVGGQNTDMILPYLCPILVKKVVQFTLKVTIQKLLTLLLDALPPILMVVQYILMRNMHLLKILTLK